MNNKSLEKIKLVLDIIQKKRKNEPKKESFELPPEEFTKFPILKDLIGLAQTFKKIRGETNENILINLDRPYIEDNIFHTKTELPLEVSIYIEDFKKFDQYRKRAKERLKQIKDTDKPIFVAEKGLILFEDKKCKIPHNTKQYDLCKIMFGKAINERVSWHEIADAWKGYSIGLYKGTDQIKKEEWREVYDAVNAVNKKVKQKLQIKRLFQYKDKSVIKLK